jgi:hypothetical protein
VDSLHGYVSEGWALFEFTRINIEPTILRKKIEDLREVTALSDCGRATMLRPGRNSSTGTGPIDRRGST